MRKDILFLVFLLLVLSLKVEAQSSPEGSKIVIDKDFKMALMGRNMKMFTVPEDQEMGFEEIARLEEKEFDVWKNSDLIFGYVSKSRWLYFEINNLDTIARELVFEVVDPAVFNLEFYREKEPNNFIIDTLKFNDNFLKRAEFQENKGHLHRNLQFNFTIPQGTTSRCYLHLPPAKYPQSIRLFLWDKEYRRGWQQFFESYILLTFYILSVIYLLLLGISIFITRFHFFWYYFFYVLLGMLYMLSYSGLAYRYVWTCSSYIQQISSSVFLNLYLITGVQFIRKYFNSARLYPNLDKALFLSILTSVIVLLLSLMVPIIDSLSFAHWLNRFNNFIFVFTGVILFVLLFQNLFTKQKFFPGIFLIGFLIHGVNIIITSLQGIGLIPAGTISGYLMQIGHPLTIQLQLAFMIGMLVEMGVVFYLGIKRFSAIYRENNVILQNLASQKQKTMNALVQGIERERERWSHELHDGLGVKLAILQQEVASLIVQRNKGIDVEAKLKKLENELALAHTDLRNISHHIMPTSLRKLGLAPAIEELLHRFRLLDANREINFYSNVELKNFSPFAQSQLYHIIQELLNNMNKHAHASEVNLQFVKHEQNLLITLEDNGRGFNRNLAYRNGIGLKNISNRVSVLGGKLSIDTAIGKGSMISVEIPIAELIKQE